MWDRVDLVDEQSADLPLFSQQGLSFWACCIKTDVWVVDLGSRDAVVDKSVRLASFQHCKKKERICICNF